MNGGATTKNNGKVPGKQTNNRAELQGLVESLLLIKELKKEDIRAAEITSDSEILVNGIHGKAKRKANRDLWCQIEGLFSELREDVTLVVRHVPREENKEADALASEAANSLI